MINPMLPKVYQHIRGCVYDTGAYSQGGARIMSLQDPEKMSKSDEIPMPISLLDEPEVIMGSLGRPLQLRSHRKYDEKNKPE